MQEESHFLIVGLGLLGGSYAQGLKRKGFHVSALDLNPESIAYALKQGWIDEGAVGFDEALVRQADSVVFGLYPPGPFGVDRSIPGQLCPGNPDHRCDRRQGTNRSAGTGKIAAGCGIHRQSSDGGPGGQRRAVCRLFDL